MKYSALFIIALSLVAVSVVSASDRKYPDDHDRARKMVVEGELMPLGDVVNKATAEGVGRIVEVELEREDGRWVYELKAFDSDNRRFKYYYDARTGELLKKEGGKSGRRNKE